MRRRHLLGIAMFVCSLHATAVGQVPVSLPDGPHIAVVGRGAVQAEPDFAEFTFNVSLVRESVADAKAQIDSRVGTLFTALDRLHVPAEHVEASTFSIDPRYEQKEDAIILLGYNVSRTVEVRLTDLELFDELLNEAIAAGITSFWGADVKSNSESDLRARARSAAVDDARSQAEALAAAVGGRLGSVYTVVTEEARSATRQQIFGMPGEYTVRFRPGPITFHESVYAVFLLEPADGPVP